MASFLDLLLNESYDTDHAINDGLDLWEEVAESDLIMASQIVESQHYANNQFLAENVSDDVLIQATQEAESAQLEEPPKFERFYVSNDKAVEQYNTKQ